MQRDLFQIRHGIEVSGNVCVFTRKTQAELRDDPTRIARLVQETRASAWLLVSASLAVVKWFEAQSFPVLAWGGRVAGTSISSCAVDIAPALRQAIRELGRLGHKRVVMIGPAMWRHPCLGTGFVRAFLDELSALGVRWSEYNLPDWEETPEGLKNLLESLFRVTPPQALIVDHASRLPAILGILARRGLRVPKDISLACIHQDASLSWCDPPIAHMCYDDTLPIRYILKWVQMTVTGKVERKHFNFPAEFDPAGSIGLVPA
jgi:DNA-binding LacI/PurR family transcriptional regulator